jgi:transposase
MMGSLDPLGMPLATDVLSGERADDGLYIPIIERIRAGLQTPGLLFVGDCKISVAERSFPFLNLVEMLYQPST